MSTRFKDYNKHLLPFGFSCIKVLHSGPSIVGPLFAINPSMEDLGLLYIENVFYAGPY